MTHIPRTVSVSYHSGIYLAQAHLRIGFSEGSVFYRRFVNPDDLADFLRALAADPVPALCTMVSSQGVPWCGPKEYTAPDRNYIPPIALDGAEL